MFKAVESGGCSYGILPIENSIHGTVIAVYDLMKNYNFHIIKSIKLKINHALMANQGADLSNITEIFSHEQAIGQCSEFLKEYPDVKVFSNTATVGAYKINKSQLTSCAIPDGSVILWDEGGIDFNNRKYNDMDQALIRFLKLHGHSKLTILVFSQSWDDVDITLRRLAEYIFYIRRMGQFTMIRSISRFFFMDDQFHEIRSGYRWTPLWYYLFYPFWRIKPIYFMFRPLYVVLSSAEV